MIIHRFNYSTNKGIFNKLNGPNIINLRISSTFVDFDPNDSTMTASKWQWLGDRSIFFLIVTDRLCLLFTLWGGSVELRGVVTSSRGQEIGLYLMPSLLSIEINIQRTVQKTVIFLYL